MFLFRLADLVQSADKSKQIFGAILAMIALAVAVCFSLLLAYAPSSVPLPLLMFLAVFLGLRCWERSLGNPLPLLVFTPIAWSKCFFRRTRR